MLALMQRLREAGEALPACAWLVSPWTDLTMSGDTLASKDAVDPLIHKPYLEELAAAYVPAGIDRRAAQVSVTLEVWPHMIHAWPLWNAGLDAGRQAIDHLGAFARRHLA